MKKGFVSKLEKLLLIPAAAMILNSNVAKAQNDAGIGIDCSTSRLWGKLNSLNGKPELAPYANWKANFKPASPNMNQPESEVIGPSTYFHNLDKHNWVFEIEPYVYAWRIRVGAPFSTPTIPKQVISKIDLKWWDRVTMSDAVLKETAPYGISTNITLLKVRDYDEEMQQDVRFNLDLRMRMMTSDYSVTRRDYYGHDVYGGKNWSEIFSEYEIGHGKSTKYRAAISMTTFMGDKYQDAAWNCHYELGYNYERYGKDHSFKGIYFSIGLGLGN